MDGCGPELQTMGLKIVLQDKIGLPCQKIARAAKV
jgi:hypothetical protein